MDNFDYVSSPKNIELSELLFDKFPEPKWIYDVHSLRILAVNEIAIEKYGYAKSELLSMTINDIVYYEDLSLFEETIINNIHDNNFRTGVFRHKKKFGSIFQVQLYSYRIDYENKNARILLSIDLHIKPNEDNKSTDLSEKLLKQIKQSGIILNSIDEFIWLRRTDTKQMIYTNHNSKKVLGFTEREMYKDGHNLFWKVVHPEDRQNVQESMGEIFTGLKQKVHHKFRVLHNDGSISYAYSTVMLIKGNNNEPDTILGVTRDITESVVAENLFKQKAKELNDILNTINDCYFTLDKDFNYIYANDAYLKMINKSRADIIGKNMIEIFPYLNQLRIYDEYTKAIKENVKVQFDIYSPFIDKWMSIRAYPTITGLTICLTDITESKKLLNQIIEKEYNLKSLIDNTQDFIFSVDLNFNIISINEPFKQEKYKTTGILHESGSSILNHGYGPVKYKEYWESLLRKAIRGEIFTNIEKRKVNNEYNYFETRFNQIFNDLNEVTGVSCFIKNITEQINLNEKIQDNEANLRALINNTKDKILSVDKDLKLIVANEAFIAFIKKLTGKEPKLGDIAVFEEMPIEFSNKWRKYAQRAFNGEIFTIVEKSIDNSKESYAESSFNPIFNNKSEVIGVTCFIRDITEQILYLDRIKSQNQVLKDIAWVQSHKMRSRVATILGLGQLLNTDDITDPVNEFVVNSLVQTTIELDEIIKEINQKTQSIGD